MCLCVPINTRDHLLFIEFGCCKVEQLTLCKCRPGLVVSYTYQPVEDQRLVGSSVECLLV